MNGVCKFCQAKRIFLNVDRSTFLQSSPRSSSLSFATRVSTIRAGSYSEALNWSTSLGPVRINYIVEVITTTNRQQSLRVTISQWEPEQEVTKPATVPLIWNIFRSK
ncbi:hypothetical protein Hdeb2414_s0001g00008391 [Helianthus debilis subsp. tardiflorus]